MTALNLPPDRMDPVLGLLAMRPRRGWKCRFHPEARAHDPENAVALCNAAILTYATSSEATSYLIEWGFTDITILRGYFTQGFVAHKHGIIVVAFRGTEPINADDWLSDVNYHQRLLIKDPPGALGPPPGLVPKLVPGSVHGGFAHALEEVLSPLVEAVQKHIRTGAKHLFVTGHSLGGALAVLAASVLQFGLDIPVAGVYTYGQPRVGDSRFSDAYNTVLGRVTFRYVNDLDIVPHLPPAQLPRALVVHQRPSARTVLRTLRNAPEQIATGIKLLIQGERFAHVGQLMLFMPDGSLTADERAWQQREAIYSGPLLQLLRDSPSLLRAGLRKALFAHDRILHHDPLKGYLRRLEARLPKPQAT
jgi:triacylglycerol lipase